MGEQAMPVYEGEIIERVQSEGLVTISRDELDVQVSTAKAYPRDIATWRADVLSALAADPDLAAVCTYSVKKGGDAVTGPSIRLAMLLISEWQNFRVQTVISEVGKERVVVTCRMWDLERNQAVSVEEPRSIVKKDGGRYSADMIVTTIRAATSLAMRAAVFKCIPERLWRPLWHESQNIASQGDSEKIPERRKVAVSFCVNRLKVTEEQIAARLGVDRVDLIDAARLAELKQIIEAIRDGETSAKDEFGPIVDKRAGDIASAVAGERGVVSVSSESPDADSSPALHPAVDALFGEKPKSKVKPNGDPDMSDLPI